MRIASIVFALMCMTLEFTACGGSGSSNTGSSSPSSSAPGSASSGAQPGGSTSSGSSGSGNSGSSSGTSGSGGSSASGTGSGSSGSSGSGSSGSGSGPGSGGSGSGSGSGSTGATGPQYLYTANLGSSNSSTGSISGFSIDANSATLTPISGSPFAADFNPSALTSDPKGRFLFIGESGVVPGTRGANCLNGQAKLLVETISANTGALTKSGEITLAGSCPGTLVVDPNGQNLYVGDFSYPSSEPQIEAFVINGAGQATPLPGSPFAASKAGNTLAMGPDGSAVYAEGSTAITVFTRNASGTLTAGQTIQVNTGYSLAISKSGAYLIAGLRDSSASMGQNDTVSVYSIDSSGNLTLASSAKSGIQNAQLDTDPLGKYVALNGFVSAGTSNGFPGGVVMFTLNSDGTLTKVAGSPFTAGNTPSSIKFDATGNLVYSTAYNDADINAYRVDRNTGALAALTGSLAKTGDFPGQLTVVAPK